MASHEQKSDGFYHVSLVDLGTRLRDNFGLTVVEHPAFGGTTPGVHSPTSYHYTAEGNAFDVQDWRGGPGLGAEGFDGVGYVQRTKNLRDLLRGSATECLGPGDPGHPTHLHLATASGWFKLSTRQYDYLFGGNSGGKMCTFAV